MPKALIFSKQKKKLWPGHVPDLYYFFRLVADNNEPIAKSEEYTEKHNVDEVLDRYFSNFEKVDKTYRKFPSI
jgi:hypothetical protein